LLLPVPCAMLVQGTVYFIPGLNKKTPWGIAMADPAARPKEVCDYPLMCPQSAE
jgi:hypothetical protein